MKKSAIALASLLFVGLTACNDNAASKINTENQTSTAEVVNQTEGQPAFSFDKEKHDFGTIEEGTVAEYSFSFTNTGDSPLIISNASGSCGCTVPVWPREPIAPGESGNILVKFDSSGKPGQQQKEVRLNANTVPNVKVLTITAQVQPKPAEGEASKS